MTLLERVEAVLLKHGIRPVHDRSDLTTGIGAGSVTCQMRISEANEMLRCLISLPVHVRDYRRSAMSEAICRINFGLYSGAMEMDFLDGELRFRNALRTVLSEPTDEEIDWLLFWSWSFVGRYAMVLLEVAVGGEPELAVARVEMPAVQLPFDVE